MSTHASTPRSHRLPPHLRLLRPAQWAKSAFCLFGPVFYWPDHRDQITLGELIPPVLVTCAIFALASSACYIINDLVDVERDRLHPRKKHRPIASGAVSVATAWAMAGGLTLAAGLLLVFLPPGAARWWVAGLVGLYALNTNVYSYFLKHLVIADVISLSGGFVLRVIAGCASIAVFPSTWLLNCTLFFAMFLAFGKRLGERRTMGADASKTRGVQGAYTDEFLRMAVVVTGVVTLVTYAGYVQSREGKFSVAANAMGLSTPVNLLWLTLPPAVYALLRAIVQVERGKFDDPTELATGDRPFQGACALFGVLLALAVWSARGG